MFNKKILAASMAAAITTGGMVAQTSAMEVAANNVGQVLLGGTYFVENSYTTDLVVVNTRTDAAVMAKVVFRSHKDSAEVLDFMIYLSPGDTWRAKMTTNAATGMGHIYSNDDSVRNASDTQWGDVDALDVDLFNSNITDPTDSNTFGHFEVISSGTAVGTYAVPAVTVAPGMSKDDVRTLTTNAAIRTVVSGGDCFNTDMPAVDAADAVSAALPCMTQLMGEVVIGNGTNRASYRPVALTAELETPAAGATLATYVITNEALLLTSSAVSVIGNPFGDGANLNTDAINEIEIALAAETSSYPWESNGTDQGTHVLATFPTKYRHLGDVAGVCGANGAGGRIAGAADKYSAPFADTTVGEITIAFSNYDNSENTTSTPGNTLSGGSGPSTTTVPDEVNYLTPTYLTTSESGWAFYAWAGDATCSYKGVPVATYTYKFESSTDFRHMMEKAANKTNI